VRSPKRLNAPIPSRRGQTPGERGIMEIHWSRGPGRPKGDDTICRVTVRLSEDYYTKVVRKMKAERRPTMADTVRVILIEYFDARKETER